MNIGFDFRMGGTAHGGIGRYAFELLKAELQIDKEDRFFVFYNDTVVVDDLRTLDEHVNVELVKVRARHYSLAEQTSFLKVLQGMSLDVMHFPNFNHPILYKKPFVVTIHDMVHHRLSGHKKSRWLYFQGYKYEMQHALLASKAILVPSNSSKQEVLNYFAGVTNKISVIYEGASLQAVSEASVERVKRQYLLTRPYFLFVGTLERKKNIVGLARGFDKLLEKYNLDVDLVFAGKVDTHYPEEKLKALEVKHSNHIVFTGYVNDEDLAALYQGAHAYTNASVNEGFGLPGVEAMRFGLPMAVSNTPVFNEIYDDAAVYFDATSPDDIADKLRLLATDQQYYELLQEKAHFRGQLFDWERTAKETLSVLRAASGKQQVVPVAPDLLAQA